MSIASRQMFLEEIEAKLGAQLTVNNTRDAMRLIADTLGSYEIEHTGAPASTSDDFMQAFLDAKQIEGRSEKTTERYKYILGKMFNSMRAPVRSITTYHVRSYLMDCRNRGLSDGTLEGIRSVMSAYFGWLWKEGLIERNPCANVGPIKCRKQIRLPYSAEEL